MTPTSSSGASRYPEITEEMVERAAKAGWYVRDASPHPARVYEAIKTTARRVLEAALDRRVGEGDRRKVNDADNCSRARRSGPAAPCGRRATDATDWAMLPFKAVRPSTPSPAEQEIRVTLPMAVAGSRKIGFAWEVGPNGLHAYTALATEVYRAMHTEYLKEMKAQGGAAYAAAIPSPQGGWLHQRSSDPGDTVGSMRRHVRAGERCWARSHRRSTDPK